MLALFVLLLLNLAAISNARPEDELQLKDRVYPLSKRGTSQNLTSGQSPLRHLTPIRVQSEVYKIDHLLQRLNSHLRPALRDIKAVNSDGTPRISAAYATFFTDTALRPQVEDILTKVITGVSMLPETETGYSLGGSPVFWSVTSHGEFRYMSDGQILDVWDTYLDENKTFTAVWYKNTPYIFLFPYFWEANPPYMYGDIPPAPVGRRPAWNCLIVDRPTNRFKTTGGSDWGMSTIQWRMWVLMEELLHYYLHLTRGVSGDFQAMNLLIAQPPLIRLVTTTAYMYYAASIYGKCTDFPRRAAERKILETDEALPAEFTHAEFQNATIVPVDE
ncbi:MAG: hypothetical protein L6R35_004426 [Caloplaca aegaea]|nr:MAG: hypothetical protein L6R35_004426 [Caloplaca aegaea]